MTYWTERKIRECAENFYLKRKRPEYRETYIVGVRGHKQEEELLDVLEKLFEEGKITDFGIFDGEMYGT